MSSIQGYETLTTLGGHRDAVNSFAFNSTGTRLASGGRSRPLSVLCPERLLTVATIHSDDDGLVIVWDITKPEHSTIAQIIFEPYRRWAQVTVVAFQPARGSAGYPIETVVFGTGAGYICEWREDKSGVGIRNQIHISSRKLMP